MGQKKRILLVDDEIDVALMFAKRLKWAGYEVLCHYQGAKVVGLLRAMQPDLVLLDIKLPDISGFDIYKDLQSDPALKKIPVVFLSAMHEEAAYCIETLGAKGFIQKPCDPKVLMETVARVMADAGS